MVGIVGELEAGGRVGMEEDESVGETQEEDGEEAGEETDGEVTSEDEAGEEDMQGGWTGGTGVQTGGEDRGWVGEGEGTVGETGDAGDGLGVGWERVVRGADGSESSA